MTVLGFRLPVAGACPEFSGPPEGGPHVRNAVVASGFSQIRPATRQIVATSFSRTRLATRQIAGAGLSRTRPATRLIVGVGFSRTRPATRLIVGAGFSRTRPVLAALVITAALCGAAVVRGQVTTSTAGQGPQPAAISGRVIDGATGAPLSGAVVTLATARDGPSAASQDEIVGRQATDHTGRFLFTGVQPGRSYRLRSSKPGYLNTGFDPEDPRSTPRRFAPTQGQWLSGVTIQLWRPNAIAGTILDEAGEPIVGAYVGVVVRTLVAGVHQFASGPTAITDDRGVYRIAPLLPGTYAVTVPSIQFAVPRALPAAAPSRIEADGFARDGTPHFQTVPPSPGLSAGQHAIPQDDGDYLVTGQGALLLPPPGAGGRRQAYPGGFHPSVRSLADATLIELGPGEERLGVDVVLQPVPVWRLSGVVEGPSGAITNRRLRLMAPGTEHLGLGHEVATAFSGADGRFSFINVPDGQYTLLAHGSAAGLSVSAGGLITPSVHTLVSLMGNPTSGVAATSTLGTVLGARIASATDPVRLESDGGPRRDALYARVPVGITGADRTDVRVRLQNGVSVSGRLVIETPDARRALEMRRSALEVLAAPAEGGPVPRSARSSTPLKGSSLDFTLADLLPGDYVLRMYADSGRIKSVTWAGRDYTGLPFPVADRDISGMVITVTPDVARAEGIVRDAQGNPARHAAVIHFPVDPARWRRYGPQPERLRSVPVRTSTYAMGAPAGEYYVLAVDEAVADSWRDPAFLEAASRVATRVTLSWGETRTRDLVVVEVSP